MWLARPDGTRLRRLPGRPTRARTSRRRASPLVAASSRSRAVERRHGSCGSSRSAGGPVRRVGRAVRDAVWAPDGRALAAMEGFNQHARVVVYSREGRRLWQVSAGSALWSSRGDLALNEPAAVSIRSRDGKLRARFLNLVAAAWSPDGRLLALAGADGLRGVTAEGKLHLRVPGVGTLEGEPLV